MLLPGFYVCSLVRELLPPWSYSWVWAGEEYLALGAFLASLPTCVSVFVDSTSETTECLPQTSAAGVGSEEQQHQSRWHSGTFGMEVSRERPCFQWQKAHDYTRSHTFQGVAKHGLQLHFSHWFIQSFTCLLFHPTILLSGLTHPTFARYYLEVETLERVLKVRQQLSRQN